MEKGVLVLSRAEHIAQCITDYLLSADIGTVRFIEMVTIPRMDKIYVIWEGNEAGDRLHLVEAIRENFTEVSIDICLQGTDLLLSSSQASEGHRHH
jgi:hypothetical protein